MLCTAFTWNIQISLKAIIKKLSIFFWKKLRILIVLFLWCLHKYYINVFVWRNGCMTAMTTSILNNICMNLSLYTFITIRFLMWWEKHNREILMYSNTVLKSRCHLVYAKFYITHYRHSAPTTTQSKSKSILISKLIRMDYIVFEMHLYLTRK